MLNTTQQEYPASTYSQFAIGAALLRLQADTLGDEEVLTLCRAAGLSVRLIERLLGLGRVAEAVQELQNAREFDLLSLVQLFVDHGHGELAETLAHEYAAAHGDRNSQIQSWLRDRALAREDWEGALALTQARFFDYRSGNEYDRLCRIATRLGRWEEVREQILAQRPKRKMIIPSPRFTSPMARSPTHGQPSSTLIQRGTGTADGITNHSPAAWPVPPRRTIPKRPSACTVRWPMASSKPATPASTALLSSTCASAASTAASAKREPGSSYWPVFGLTPTACKPSKPRWPERSCDSVIGPPTGQSRAI